MAVTISFPGDATSSTRPFSALLVAFFAPDLVPAPAFAFRAAFPLGADSPFDASSFGASSLAFDASESDESVCCSHPYDLNVIDARTPLSSRLHARRLRHLCRPRPSSTSRPVGEVRQFRQCARNTREMKKLNSNTFTQCGVLFNCEANTGPHLACTSLSPFPSVLVSSTVLVLPRMPLSPGCSDRTS